jgi:hypothetical protein
MRVKTLAEPVDVEPPRSGEDAEDCVACNTPDDAYIWVSERWRVRGMDRPTGLPMVLILECRSHLDIGDLPNLLAAELGVMTVRLERAIRSLDGVARVHVNRWGDGSAHLHMWFLARPYGRLQLRGTFLSLWDDILPVIPEEQWLENLALVAEWLAGFGGRAIAEPAHIHWLSPSTFGNEPTITPDTPPAPDTWQPPIHTDSPSAGFTWNNATPENQEPASEDPAPTPSNSTHRESDGATPTHSTPAPTEPASGNSTSEGAASEPASRSDLTAVNAETRDLSSYAIRPGTTPTPADEPDTDSSATASVGSPTPSADNAPAPRQPAEAPTPQPPSASSPASADPADAPSTDASGTGTAPTTASTPAPPATSNPTHDPNNSGARAGQATQSEPSTAPAIPSQYDAKTAEAAAHPDRRPATPQSATATDNPATTQAAPSH